MGKKGNITNTLSQCSVIKKLYVKEAHFKQIYSLTNAAETIVGEGVASTAGAYIGTYCISAVMFTAMGAFHTLIYFCLEKVNHVSITFYNNNYIPAQVLPSRFNLYPVLHEQL